MFSEILFKNYKAFKKGSLQIKPITLLLGANAIGKTSILQLITLLHQTSLSGEKYQSALKINGGFINIGECINLFNKHSSNITLEFEIKFIDNNLFLLLKEELISNIYSEVEFIRYQNLLSNDKNSILSELDSIKALIYKKDRKLAKNKKDFENLINNVYLNNKISTIDQLSKRIKIYSANNTEMQEYIHSYNILEDISDNLKNDNFSIKFELATKSDLLYTKTIKIFNEEFNLMTVEFDINDEFQFSKLEICNKPIVISSKLLYEFRKIFISSISIFSTLKYFERKEKEKEKENILISTVVKIFNNSIKSLKSSFEISSINYVSPLRAYPKRYYLLDKRNIDPFLDTLDGDAIAEKLKENPQLIENVNSWLAKFNVSIEVTKIKDIIHSFNVKRGSLKMDLTDVGFGISQILPVIVQGFLSSDNSLTIVEQPEIHLHPKMQADLGDLFLDIIRSKQERQKNKYFIIETHSEYLLKRLRRRISEKIISSDDVAIYIIKASEEEENVSIIEKLEINKTGDFLYPEEFYGKELLDDTVFFLKNQDLA